MGYEKNNPGARTSIIKVRKWFITSPAMLSATILLMAGIYFGSSRGFGDFLLSIPLLPILFAVALGLTAWSARLRAERPKALVACALICLTPLAYYFSYGITQRIGFLIWAPLHYRQLADAYGKNGIVMGWDTWGWAAGATSSYLVVDTEDQLESEARAKRWTTQVGETCGLWEARRMWPRLYIVTTYTDCPYQGVPPAN